MKRLLTLLIAAAAIAAAQNTTVVDNDQVRVLKVTQKPHVKTGLHDHKVNRVMIYLQPGKQNFDYEGTKKVLDWKAGQALWSPASGKHIAEIVSDNPVTIVEVELKKPGTPGKTSYPALDPVKVDPKHYKVEMENDQVRVLRVKFPAHAGAPMHEHARGRVVVYLTDNNMKVTTDDGNTSQTPHKPGDVAFAGVAKHKELNDTDKPVEVLVVELKS